MADDLVDSIWDDVYRVVGDDLRVVTRFNATDYETRMRDDVREQYTEAEDREIITDTIVKQLGFADGEELFDVGELDGVVRVFEDAWFVTWSDRLPQKSGVNVSIERNGDTATMDDVDWCLRYLKSEVSGRIE